MNCEICGREIAKEPVSVKIEGTLMRVCRSCARLGEEVRSRTAPTSGAGPSRRPVHTGGSEKTIDVVEGYDRLIRREREKLGLTQEQLGAKINEKGSVIARLESGHMKPDIKTARKLERLFRVRILEELEE
ncbi:MAG: TIGR00270 family protein [Methanobacteriota archaeon]|nr:MAG: TIGR00270 family protein [Euryarchaeota archaeon]